MKTSIGHLLPFIFLLLMAPRCLHAQETPASHHPWNWEVGVRTTNPNMYYSHWNDFYWSYSKKSPAVGLELFVSKRFANHCFLRLGAGFGSYKAVGTNGFNVLPGNQYNLPSTLKINSLSSEVAYGYELPLAHRAFWDRFRVRTGLSVHSNYGAVHSYRVETMQSAQQYAFYHETIRGGIQLRTAVFLQVEMRLAQAAFIGFEWRYGPSLFLGKVTDISNLTSSDDNGYFSSSFTSKEKGWSFNTWSPIGLPMLQLGYSF